MKSIYPVAIISSDWHLRNDQPICRKDDFLSALESKVRQILRIVLDTQSTTGRKIPLLIAGDLFHVPKTSQFIEQWIVGLLMSKEALSVRIIPGQHDLPNHNIELFENSSIGVIKKLGLAQDIIVYRTPFEQIQEITIPNCDLKIGMVHTFIAKPNDKQDKMISSNSADIFLKKHNFDVIISGDNHKTFCHSALIGKNRLLINPGSLMRSNASQMDHEPCVFILFSDGSFKKQVLDFAPGEDVIEREYIDKENRRDERVESFVSKLETDYEIDLSFEKNLETFFNNNQVRKGVYDKCWEAVK